MDLKRFGTHDKVKALQREIALRKHVYAKRVHRKDMLQATADYEIKIFEEILHDYLYRWAEELSLKEREKTDDGHQ